MSQTETSRQKSHIAILGAGITGLMAARTLFAAGHKITLYDPAPLPAHNASWMAGGMVAPYSEIEHMDAGWIAASLESTALWQEINSALDIGYTQKGSLLIAHPEDRHALERFRAHLPPKCQDLIAPQTLEPQIPEKFRSGLYLEEEGHLEPRRVILALAEHLRQGANIIQQAVEPQDIEADFIIDCRGLGNKNDPELRGVKGETLLVRNTDFALTRPVRLMHPRYPLYIVPRGEGVFMIGATNIESEDSDHASLRSAMELMSALYSLHPSFGEAQILEIGVGVRPSYPDNLPRITQKGNIISANGLFRHGFLLAPLMAEIITAKIAGEPHKHERLFNGKGADKSHDQRAA